MSKNILGNDEYWVKRATRIVEAGENNALDMLKKLRTTYIDAKKTIQKEIEAFHGRYAKETGITLTDVNKRLNKSQLNSAQEDIERYNREIKRLGWDDPQYQHYLRNLSSRAYMSRLEELQLNIRHEIETLNGNINDSFTDGMRNTFVDTYYHENFNIQQGFGLSMPFAKLNTKMINTAINQKWVGDNYSGRLWTHKNRLLDSLNITFLQGIALGHNPQKIARTMTKELDTNYNNVVRLARTEFINIANQADLKTYDQYGFIKQYQYLAVLDHRTSDICSDLDGEIFPVSEAKTGINYPPAHPNCRSTTTAYFPPDEIDEIYGRGERLATDPVTGNRYYIPADMTYKQWRQSLTENQEEHLIKRQTMQSQRSADKKQYNDYKEAIGKQNMPKSFDKFQEMKYHNIKEWDSLKDYKLSVTNGNISPLVSFDDYQNSKEIFNKELIGLKTSTRIEIKSYSKHFIERYFGGRKQYIYGINSSDDYYRSGVELKSIISALTSDNNPIHRFNKNNTESLVYKGLKAKVSINPITGNIIQTNPRGKEK